MTVRFNLTGHWEKPGGQMIEIFDGDRFIGGIYPDAHGIRVVSKYLVNYADRLSIDTASPPALNIILTPLTEMALAEMMLKAKGRQ